MIHPGPASMALFLALFAAIFALLPTMQNAIQAKSVLKYALLSRFCILILATLADNIVPDYDTSWNVVQGQNASVMDRAIFTTFGALAKWDSMFFLRISDHGYEFEKYHAFFPLLPLLIRGMTDYLMSPLFGAWACRLALLTLSGWIVSTVSFVFAAFHLYRIGIVALRDEKMSFVSSMLFCIAPSNVFLSASGYTESLYAMFTFAGVDTLYKSMSSGGIGTFWWGWLSAICFALTGATRSTGVMHAGYIAYVALYELRKRSFWHVFPRIGQCLLVFVPYIVFQWFAFERFCPGRPWCKTMNVYPFVQSEYWGVGFLKYYELKQLPNFGLVAPAIALSFAGVLSYVRKCPSSALYTLGLASKDTKTGYGSPLLIPHVVLWAVLLALGLTNMHVQVLTRVLSPVAAFYWFAAYIVLKLRGSRLPLIVILYFVGYSVVGVVLFSNFYPWT